MGKRSEFPRRDRDRYPTPAKAARPLLPFLRGIRHFAEPCVGDGDLVRHLEAAGMVCIYRGDIATGQDALAVERFDVPVITNPPFADKLLRPLIRHFLASAPLTWLLLPMDRLATQRMASLLPYCSDVVAIGRVRWIEGSQFDGKENFGWFRFNADHTGGPIIHPRGAAPGAMACDHCGRAFRAGRADAVFCTPACRQAAYRRRSRHTAVTPRRTSIQTA